MHDNLTNAEKQQLVATAIAGWREPLPPTMETVVVRGETLTSTDVLTRLQAFQALLQAPDRARVALQAAVSQRRLGEPAGWTFVADLASVVRQQFPGTADLSRFGVSLPTPPAKPSVETVAIANVKRQATRQEHHVMGSRQRAAITTTPEPTLVVHLVPEAAPASAVPSENA